MRPHLLRLTAFGPFAGTVEVDLDALSAAGLFLLHGPTGAGKTTVLDGIGFALFSRVPGARGEAKRLRCDRADPRTRTEVQLEATLLGRRVRITRSPAWERPKTRGEGTTTEPARVLLEERVGDTWTTVSTRPREADDEIADLVGMSAEQFFQVVLLPQGEFAKFLRADSKDRESLLRRLFATERFADVEGWLAQRRRVTAEQAAAARADLSRVVARVAQVADCDVPEHADLAWALSLQRESVTEHAVVASRVEELTRSRDRARLELDQVLALQQRQARRRNALDRQARLAAQEPQRQQLHACLDAATRAAQVRGALAAVAVRQAERDDALAAETAARARLADPDLPLEALQGLVDAARERAGHLDGLRAVDEARALAVQEAARAQEEQADHLAAAHAAEVTLAVLPARLAELEQHLTTAREAAATLPVRVAERTALAALRPAVVERGLLQSRIAVLDEEQRSARERALSLERKALDLQVASVNSMIARLAAHLEDGVPCEVCGSPDHPDPSALRDEGVSSDDEQRARADADAAQQEVARLLAELAAARATAEALQAQVGPWTLASLDQQVAELDLELDLLTATAARLPEVEAQAKGVEEQRRTAAQDQVAAATHAEAAGRRAEAAGHRAAVATAQLAEAVGSDLDLPSAIASCLDRAALAQQALEAARRRTALSEELDRFVVEARTACQEAGFADPEQARAAVRTPEWIASTSEELRAAADAAAAVTAELADPELAVDLAVPAPVEHGTAALAAADADLSAAQQQLGDRAQRVAALDVLVPELEDRWQQLAPLEELATRVRCLADLCTGGGANAMRMTLASFVLAARLEQVAAVASTRLLRMTEGRYSLHHTDSSARGGARSGLGLRVRDTWCGQDRDTATLSGGETFLAALALALGLADVVSEEAGGARIGALFVDEGFGTLDEDSLDEVMDVLDGLREGGRVVGLVSHVAELKQRIPAQVVVTKTRTGSDLTLRGC